MSSSALAVALDDTLVRADGALLALTRFEDWHYAALPSSPQRPPAGTMMAPMAEAAKT